MAQLDMSAKKNGNSVPTEVGVRVAFTTDAAPLDSRRDQLAAIAKLVARAEELRRR